MAKGLAVVQGNADTDLPVYPDDAYDVAILSKTIQELARPKFVLDELSRIARRVIVSFRNYGHWRVRTAAAHHGSHPVTLGHDAGWWSRRAPPLHRPRHGRTRRRSRASPSPPPPPSRGKPVTAKSLGRLNWTAEELLFVLEPGRSRKARAPPRGSFSGGSSSGCIWRG